MLLNIISFLTLLVNSGDTVYLNENIKVKKTETFDSYEVYEYLPSDSNTVTIHSYYKSGKPKSEELYSDYKHKKHHGFSRKWYEDGNLKQEIQYNNGFHHGKLTTYWPNGILKRKEFYRNDSLIKGYCYKHDGTDTTYYKFEIMPEFPGGEAALFQFIGEHIKYPSLAIENNISGKVYIDFVIDPKGLIKDTKVLRGIGAGCDEEAMRVINSMPKWKPGLQDGVPVNVSFKMPINFKLTKRN